MCHEKTNNTSPESLLPKLSPKPIQAFEIAYSSDPGRTTESSIAFYRQALVALVDDVLSKHPDEIQKFASKLINHFSIGISYIMAQKGDERLKEYCGPEKLSEILNIGRTVFQKYCINPIKKLKGYQSKYDSTLEFSVILSNAFYVVTTEVIANIKLFKQDKTFKGIHEMMEVIDNWHDLYRFYKGLLELIEICELSEQIHLTPEAIESECSPYDSGTKHFIQQTTGTVGVLELGIFIAVYRHCYKLKGKDILSLPNKEAEKFFNNCSTGSQGILQLNQETKEKYREACQKLFGEKASLAWMITEQCIEQILEIANFKNITHHKNRYPFCFPVKKIDTGNDEKSLS